MHTHGLTLVTQKYLYLLVIKCQLNSFSHTVSRNGKLQSTKSCLIMTRLKAKRIRLQELTQYRGSDSNEWRQNQM